MNFFDFSFWQNFGSNLLATLIGVVIGIPIALLINRWGESIAEREKKGKILRLLSTELNENRRVVFEWKEAGSDDESMTTIGALMGDEVWNAFSDGGELQWIKDPLLLGDLAFTYAEIRRLKYLSDKYLALISLDRDTELSRDIANQLWLALDDVWRLISDTLERVDKHRGIKRMTEKELLEIIDKAKSRSKEDNPETKGVKVKKRRK